MTTEALASDVKVKLNSFGTLQTKECPRGATVRFTVSPILRKTLNR